MRFEVVHDYHSNGKGLDGETKYSVIWADRFGVPKVTIEKNSKGYVVTNIEQGNNDIVSNPKYEYRIDDYVQAEKLAIENIIAKINKKHMNTSEFTIDPVTSYSDEAYKWNGCSNKTIIKNSPVAFSNSAAIAIYSGNDLFIKVKVKVTPVSGSYICIRRKAATQNGLMVFPSKEYIFKVP